MNEATNEADPPAAVQSPATDSIVIDPGTPRTGVPDLAWRIAATVGAIADLPKRRGATYQRLVVDLVALCGGRQHVAAELLGITQQAIWQTLHRTGRANSDAEVC